MAAKKKAAKAGAAAIAVKNSPYVQRLVEDEELRANIAQAYDSARSAANRFQNGKSPTKAVFDDKKLQKRRPRTAPTRCATRASRCARGPQRKRRGGFGKFLLVAIVGAGLALALSEGLRKKVLDTLFGAEEEFEYSSATTASPPVTPAQPAGSTS